MHEMMNKEMFDLVRGTLNNIQDNNMINKYDYLFIYYILAFT